MSDRTSATRFSVTAAAITPGDGRYVMSTLSTGEDPPLTVVKAVTVSPDNPDQGLPAINGAITVFDSRTGLLRAVMGANWITAVRTACARSLLPPEAPPELMSPTRPM